MKQARIYGRFSSKPQERGDSIRRQVEGAKEYAKRMGIAVIGQPYFDEGVSGKAGLNLEKEFGRLLAEAKEGELLLVEELDRIGRQNPFILGNLIYQTVQKGVEIHVFKENKTINVENIEDFSTQIQVFTSGAIGHQENRRKIGRINETVKQTMDSAAKGELVKGAFRFTPQAYKWDDVNKKVYIDEDMARVVRQIFTEYNKGVGTTTIAAQLNKAKTPTLYTGKGKSIWYGNSIKFIILCECYCGVLAINGNKYDILPRIVSKEVYNKAQMHMARNKTNKGNLRGRTNNLFGQIVYCKYCGGRVKSTISGKNAYTYCCKNSLLRACVDKGGRSYENKMISSRWIEYGFFKTFFGKGAHSLLKSEDRNIELKEQIEVLNSKSATLNKAIDNLYNLVEAGDKEAARRITARKVEQDETQQQIKVLQAQLTEDGQFESQVTTIYKMITLDDIWKGKKKLVPIMDILDNNENRKTISQIMPTLFSKIVFDFQTKVVEAFDKNEKSLGKYNPYDFVEEVKGARTTTTQQPETEFDPPARTFKPRQTKTKNTKKIIKDYLADPKSH